MTCEYNGRTYSYIDGEWYGGDNPHIPKKEWSKLAIRLVGEGDFLLKCLAAIEGNVIKVLHKLGKQCG